MDNITKVVVERHSHLRVTATTLTRTKQLQSSCTVCRIHKGFRLFSSQVLAAKVQTRTETLWLTLNGSGSDQMLNWHPCEVLHWLRWQIGDARVPMRLSRLRSFIQRLINTIKDQHSRALEAGLSKEDIIAAADLAGACHTY